VHEHEWGQNAKQTLLRGVDQAPQRVEPLAACHNLPNSTATSGSRGSKGLPPADRVATVHRQRLALRPHRLSRHQSLVKPATAK
jgi:hypothetical protein